MKVSKNLIQLWEENDCKVPFKASRDNWSAEYCVVVEKVEVVKYPYGNVYGYPMYNGKKNDHFSYDKRWREERIIPNCGSYQWSLVSENNVNEQPNSQIIPESKAILESNTALERKTLTDNDIVRDTWHWVVEDKLGYDFAIEMLLQDDLISNEAAESIADRIEEIYRNYFMDRFGIELFGKCPNCTGKMVLKESVYGEFMACNQYPNCKTIFKDKFKGKISKF
ncbi:MAG: hypothetical protein K0R80_2902 [Clostridia bacterium]|nr:hypothetical protein [Clostridia bacterium]